MADPTLPASASAAQRSNAPGLTARQFADAFVERRGSRLTVAGRPFRFSGANVEYLGLQNYGPNNSASIPAGSQRYPTRYEIDDVLATAHEMGATVLRVQTLGDSVGCRLCLEPRLGEFNAAAFAQTDLVVAEARRYGIKLLGEFDGDANATAPTGSSNFQAHSWYCTWEHVPGPCGASFFSDPRLLADYERHMKAVLTHRNPLTGLTYGDDPTVAGWVDGNNLNLLDGVPPPVVEKWLSSVSASFKSLDRRQLFLDISLTAGNSGVATPSSLAVPGIDVYGQEYYPHWFPGVQGGDRVDGSALPLHRLAAQVAASGKAYATLEFGWDSTDFLSTGALQQFLDGLVADPNVAGDGVWALEGHRAGHGWQPLPADAGCVPTCQSLEDGNWWALYYTGRATLSNTAPDMAARAQLLRSHAYRLAGLPVPGHERVPAPSAVLVRGSTLTWQGSAGGVDDTVERRSTTGGAWSTVCRHCATDPTGTWTDPHPVTGACYRVSTHDLDGRPSRPSSLTCRTPTTDTRA